MRMCDTAMERVAQAPFGGGGGATVEEVEVEVGEVGAVAEEEAEAEGEAMTAREQYLQHSPSRVRRTWMQNWRRIILKL